jgi:hypothetical protein
MPKLPSQAMEMLICVCLLFDQVIDRGNLLWNLTFGVVISTLEVCYLTCIAKILQCYTIPSYVLCVHVEFWMSLCWQKCQCSHCFENYVISVVQWPTISHNQFMWNVCLNLVFHLQSLLITILVSKKYCGTIWNFDG